MLVMEKFGKLVSLLILPLVGEIIYSTLKSYFLNDTPIWSFEVTLFLYGSLFMLGGAYCHKKKKHVAVEIFSQHATQKQQKFLGVFSEAVVLFVALVIVWVSVPYAWRSTLMGERSTHQTPFNPQIWWFKWIIPISNILISWQAMENIYDLVYRKQNKK
jgi:TRAP-type mannitol/chloroaromatic compound transport system permease small subunit